MPKIKVNDSQAESRKHPKRTELVCQLSFWFNLTIGWRYHLVSILRSFAALNYNSPYRDVFLSLGKVNGRKEQV